VSPDEEGLISEILLFARDWGFTRFFVSYSAGVLQDGRAAAVPGRKLIVQLRQVRPNWGASKIREKLRRLHTEISLPAISTVHTVLDRHGLVSNARRARYIAEGTALEQSTAPNDLWCAD
jgi:hypothetical protein